METWKEHKKTGINAQTCYATLPLLQMWEENWMKSKGTHHEEFDRSAKKQNLTEKKNQILSLMPTSKKSKYRKETSPWSSSSSSWEGAKQISKFSINLRSLKDEFREQHQIAVRKI